MSIQTFISDTFESRTFKNTPKFTRICKNGCFAETLRKTSFAFRNLANFFFKSRGAFSKSRKYVGLTLFEIELLPRSYHDPPIIMHVLRNGFGRKLALLAHLASAGATPAPMWLLNWQHWQSTAWCRSRFILAWMEMKV